MVLYSEQLPCERAYGNDFNQSTGSDSSNQQNKEYNN
ncbi:hypothetical protein CCACVL1_01303 [Corchorus capsularis]|uniref:Uncharacterized protein n=1 Tax=Corchorus capsularis TaxID=210143 RepID=A0A1R3KK22_COCAP|nr:hypothetical protein CCACVL1_01303 [Corchorus capsularis]